MTQPTLRARLLRTSLVALVLLALGLAVRTLYFLHALDWPDLVVRPWCTVAASAALAFGGVAALCNKTWGLLGLLLSSVSFAAACAFGIAPPEYVIVTAGGFVCLALAAPPLIRRDATALAVVVGLAIAFGIGAGALAGPGLDLLRASGF